MLAPLKDRSILECETPAETAHFDQLQIDNHNLKSALRQARRMQKRQATCHAIASIAQTNEINRLQTLLAMAQERIVHLESGQSMIEMGARLVALSEANARLIEAAQRVWTLDRTLCASRGECLRLANERDAALRRLDQQATHNEDWSLRP
jgi:hypothetical protein